MQTDEQLTAEQMDTFKRAGYLLLPSVFGDAELEALRREADRILELTLNSSLAVDKRNPRLDLHVGDGYLQIRKVQPVNDLSEVVASVSSDPRLIGPMSALMNDQPVLMEEKLNYKQVVQTDGLDFSFIHRQVADDHFDLHHDWGYYKAQGYPENTISSAVSMDDCAGRGPIRVIPGSHAVDAPLLNPDAGFGGDGRVDPKFFEAWERVPVEAPAGSVMLFHAKLVHDSEPNRSGLPRRLMIYSHYPAGHDSGDPDRRNGPSRAYSQQFEQQYYEKVRAGEFSDQFRMKA